MGIRRPASGSEPVVGAQAPHMRVPLADGTLVATRDVPDADMIPSLLALSDVMGTGWFAADAANVKPGATVAVVGDGAVELLGVLGEADGRRADHRLEPARAPPGRGPHLRRHRHRPRARRGAADCVRALTDGLGAPHVLECVGIEESMTTAIQSARRGGSVGFVGVPHLESPKAIRYLFYSCRAAGSGTVRTYLPELTDPCCPARSIPRPSSTSSFPSTRSPRVMRRWTSGGRSRSCCKRNCGTWNSTEI